MATGVKEDPVEEVDSFTLRAPFIDEVVGAFYKYDCKDLASSI